MKYLNKYFSLAPSAFVYTKNAFAIALMAMIGATAASGATLYWLSAATGTSWNDPANWEGGIMPQTGDDVWVTVAGSSTRADKALIVMDSISATLNVLNIGQQAGTSGTLILQGNAFMQTTNATTIARHGEGTLILRGNAEWKHTVGNFAVLSSGVGTACLTMSGSSQMSLSATGNGLNNFVTGEQATGGLMRVLFEQDARFSMTANGNNTNKFYVIYGGGDSIVEIKDRAVVSTAVAVQYAQNAARTGTGSLILTGTADGERGTLLAPQIYFIGGAAADYTLDFNGGILKASGPSNNFIGNDGATSTAQLKIITRGDGAFIDSNGFDVTIADSTRYTFTGTSGLTKLGEGKLTLNNTIAYTGATDVRGGSLDLGLANQLASSSSITVANGGTISSGFAQTFNNLSGAGSITLGLSAATLGNASDTVFSGNLTADSITKTGAGSLTLSGNNTITGNIALNGGMIVIGSASAIGTGAGQTIAITSGTLGGAAATSLNLAHTIATQPGAQLAIDAGAGGRLELTGAVTGDSGVSKTGAGDLVLSGNLSGISGPLTVTQGGLFTTSYTGNVTIANGGAFGGSGTITGNVTFTGAGNLQAGLTHNDASVTTSSTLTINGALSFGGAATLSHDMYASGADTIFANSVSFGSATNTIDLVNIQSGTFTLIKITTGTFSDSILSGLNITQDGGAALNSTRASAGAALSADKTEIQITSDKTNQVLTWTGATDGNWDSSTDNWSGLDTKFVSGDKVIFNSTGSHDITIMPTGVVVSEMSITGNGSYTFTGGALTVDANSTGVLGTSFGGVSPTGVFTIDTTGTVTLANSTPNSFANGIDVLQGTLIGSVAHFGNADIANDGATIFNQTGNATYTGILTGTGVLGKTGAGTLTVGNNLSGFTGKTELEGGTLTFSASVTYNSSSITGSNANVTAGADFVFAGPTTLTNGSFTTGVNAQVGSITLSGIGSITTGNDSVINGSATAEFGNITLGNNSLVYGGVLTESGTITIGANSTILGPVVVVEGLGSIVIGSASVISGSASIGEPARLCNGFISIGASSVLHGPATVTGSGGVWLGAGAVINGAVQVRTGTLFLSATSTIDGSVSSPRDLNIDLLGGSMINGSVSIAGTTRLHLSTGTLVISNTTFPADGSAPVVTSTTQMLPSHIAGDVTIGGPVAYVWGAGKIDGTLEITNPSANVSIGPARPYYVSGSYDRTFYDNVAILEIGKIVLAGGGVLIGSGTLVTDSISFNDTLQLVNGAGVNAFTSGLIVTGSLIGSGDVIKTGSGNVILEAASSYTGNTTVQEGSLIARAEKALSPNSPSFRIEQGASLSLGGYDHTLPEVINHGRIYIGGNNNPVAGTRLTITGLYDSGNTGGVSFNIIAADNTKTLSDQLVFTNAANISGTTRVFVQFTDNRTDWTRVVYDLDPIIIAEAGELDGMFVLDDGRGYERVVMSQRDYVIKYTDQGVELKATTAAEMPAALAANAVSIMANRAAFGSVGQRLDYLHAAHSLPGLENTGVQAWAQTYYRADKLDGTLFPDSDGTVWGIQAGVDKRNVKKNGSYTTYGAFIDRDEASATLTNKTSTDLSSTGLGGYLSARSPNNWHTDLVLRYSWDNYKISIGEAYKYKDGDQSMETKGYTWGAMLRTAKHFDIANDWVLTPQTQLTYQQRKINDTTDTYGRAYAFGPENMRVNDPASFEFRLGTGLRKLITINETISLAPYLNAHFLFEFKGSLSIQTVNNAFVREDFGGSSWLFTAGLPVRLGRRIDAYADVSLQTGGPITGYGLNLGINYRW